MIEINPDLKDASNQAKFFQSHWQSLDAKMLGEYLALKSNDKVLKEYVKLCNFSGKSMIASMRDLLDSIDLPGEAQQIDRITSAITSVFYEQNQKSLKKEPTGLAFAIILLNSDLHNPNNPNKMTKDKFVENLKSLGDLEDLGLTEASAKEIYQNISDEPLNPPKALSPLSPRHALQSRGIVESRSQFCKDKGGIDSDEQACRYYLSIVDYLTEWGITKRSESALKSLLYEQNSFSVVDPETYSKRFQNFVGTKVLGFEEKLKEENVEARGFSLRLGALLPSLSSIRGSNENPGSASGAEGFIELDDEESPVNSDSIRASGLFNYMKKAVTKRDENKL